MVSSSRTVQKQDIFIHHSQGWVERGFYGPAQRRYLSPPSNPCHAAQLCLEAVHLTRKPAPRLCWNKAFVFFVPARDFILVSLCDGIYASPFLFIWPHFSICLKTKPSYKWKRCKSHLRNNGEHCNKFAETTVISQIASPVDLRPANFVEMAVISDFTALFPPALRSPEPRLLFSSMVEFLHKIKAVYHV